MPTRRQRPFRRKPGELPDALNRPVVDVVREHALLVYMAVGSLSEAARVLGVTRKTLARWVDYGGPKVEVRQRRA